MDKVTRPRRAARITGLRPPTSFTETSDEEEPELSSGESTDDDEPSEGSGTPATRMPDPRAVRHSSRAEAQKRVNYSKSHHPQDWAIMGFRRSAKRKRRSLSSDKPSKKSKKQATPASPIALSSDKTSDSDSDDEDEDDEPPNNQPPADAASPSRSQSEIPDEYHVGSDGVDEQCPKRNSPPPLPRGETSSVSVDAIIQGSYIIQKRRSSQAATEHSDPIEPSNDGPEITFANASTREIGEAMGALMDSVATPNTTNSHSTSSDNATPYVPIIAQHPVTMPMALVTPASMVTPDKACTQVGTRFGINRPYIATQPKPSTQPNPSNIDEDLLKPNQARASSNDRYLHKADQAKRPDQPSFKVSTALVDYSSSSDDDDEEPAGNRDTSPEEPQHDDSSNASWQALRDASEHAARTARAKEVASQLSSGILSQHHATSNSSSAGTANVSRQVSRDTLPDDHSPSFFEEAMAGTQTRSQSDRGDDDSRRLFDYRYSELQQSQSSTTLPKSTNTESQGDAAGQAAALTHSEDSALLQSSSA